MTKPEQEALDVSGIKKATQFSSSKANHYAAPVPLKQNNKKAKVVFCLCNTKYRVIRKVCSSFPGWVECDNEEDDWVR